jgi:hypothetical protein
VPDGGTVKCGCRPVWLTSLSVPVSAEDAVSIDCPCCGAPKGKRCRGGAAGWLPGKLEQGAAYVDVCPARLEVQAKLGITV